MITAILRRGELTDAGARARDHVSRREFMADVAAQLDVDHLAAVSMSGNHRRAIGVGEVAVAPVTQRYEHGVKIQPLLGEAVLLPDASAGLPIRLTAQQTVLDQRGQAVGQHLARDVRAHAHVLESPDPHEDLAQYQKRPLLAEHLHGSTDGAILRRPGKRLGSHTDSLSLLDRLSKSVQI